MDGDPVAIDRQTSRDLLVINVAIDARRSTSAKIGGKAILGLIVPPLDNTAIRIQVLDGADDWVEVRYTNGTVVEIAASTGGFAVASDDLAALAAYTRMRVVTVVPQTANRTFVLCLKA